ncbi:hypothetical protein OEZ85_001652 [Tetradesmus obliquus]|uniref:ABC1 atypical kinase-like domain-containing protein n=1 Tax=Tetradesmus obliquus TaxID=3088 RepID=A0ABY8U4M3_TETOB|nr:hypothetical protein OEZ85_001652 [Tetradesmus obliquus]
MKARSSLYLGPAAAAAVKAGDDILALIGSLPRTLRTLQWAVQAAVGYKRLMMSLAPDLDPEGYNAAISNLHNFWAQRLTEVCRANGGVYVKAGQFAAAFGAVPNEYRKHLALLQDKAKPRPFHVVDRVLRLELGAGAEEVFAEFSAEATAAASLAQVHKARLADGRQVAVKVQYPGLRGAANADLTTLGCLSRAAQALFPEFRLGWLFEELQLKLTEELDFHVEIHNAQKLMSCMYPSSSSGGGGGSGSCSSRCSADSRCGVTVPTAHAGLCTSKILTMEWIDGLKVNDSAALRAARISPHAVGRAMDEAFAEMTFVHGYIHSDPHPGNIMVRPTGRRGLLSWLLRGTWQPFEVVLSLCRRGLLSWLLRGTWQPFEVVLLDHGSYLSISNRLRQQYCQLWCSLFAGDSAGAAAVAIDLGGQRAGQILPVILTQRGRNKEEQKEMQRAAGVASFGDITQLLATAPRDVVELLRIAAVVRNVTASLGCSLADRLRINGTWAFRGLPSYGSAWAGLGPDGDLSEADKKFAQMGYRVNIQARLLVIRGYLAVNAVLNRTLLATLHVFGQPVVLY